MECPRCGTDNREGVTKCSVCGYDLTIPKTKAPPNDNSINVAPSPNIQYITYSYTPAQMPLPVSEAVSTKKKFIAAILAFLLGGFGVHKFYLGEKKAGKNYLLFCWTGIPFILGWIDAIIYLTMSDKAFASKYH